MFVLLQEQYVFDANINYFEVDYSRVYTNRIAQHRIITFKDSHEDSQSVIVFNSLTSVIRYEIVTVFVAKENVKVSLV